MNREPAKTLYRHDMVLEQVKVEREQGRHSTHQHVVSVTADCDNDTLLVKVIQTGMHATAPLLLFHDIVPRH